MSPSAYDDVLNIEQEYYENEDFWSTALENENERARVRSIGELIPGDVSTILDVGCGNGMFVNYLLTHGRSFQRIVGVDRSQTALSRVRAEKAQMSIDRLLFADSSFDLVTCLEVMEHLPVKAFSAGLANVCRVAAKHVIISVPYREDLLSTLIGCPSCWTQFNPDYHMRSFDDAEMLQLLTPFGFVCQELKHLGPQTNYRWIGRFLNPRPPLGQRPNPSHTSIPCPVCGFYLPPARKAVMSPQKEKANRSVTRRMISSIWPKENNYRWLVARYAGK